MARPPNSATCHTTCHTTCNAPYKSRQRYFACMVVLISVLIGIYSFPTAFVHAQTSANLLIWHPYVENGASFKRLEIVADAWTKKSGNTVTLKSVPTGEMAVRFSTTAYAQRPDIMIAPSDYAASWYANALTASVETLIDDKLRAYIPQGAWDTVFTRNRRVAIPFTVGGSLLFYNRALVRNNVPATVQQLIDQATALTDPTRRITGLYMRPDFAPTAGLYLGTGGKWIAADGVLGLTDPGLTERYLATLKDLWNSGAGDFYTKGGSITDVLDGRVAFWTGDTGELGRYRAALKDNLAVLPLLQTFGGTWQPLYRTWCVYVGSSSRFMPQAVSFAATLAGQADQELRAALLKQTVDDPPYLPLMPGILPDAVQENARATLLSGQPVPARIDLARWWDIMRRATNAVLFNDGDPAKIADQTTSAAALIAEQPK